MNRTWAVARQMMAEGLRMKLALVFLVLIGLVVLGLPFSITGDSSLTGAVQSFLTYGLNATGLLLSLLTIFLSRSLSDELVSRQIFLLMTKPLARWQYILGKWLGISLLNLIFLSFAGLVIYGMIYYIQWTHPPLDPRYDKAELQNEILAARHSLKCRKPNFSEPAKAELEKNKEEGLYANTPDYSEKTELARLTKKYEARWRVVGPYMERTFQFQNVLCERSPNKPIQLRYKTEVSQYPADEIFRALWRVGDPMKGTPVYEVPTRHVVGRYHTIRLPADAVADDHTLTVQFINVNPYEGEPQYGNVIEFRAADDVEVLFLVGAFEWNMVRLLVLVMCKLGFLAAAAILMTAVFSFPVASLCSLAIYVLSSIRTFLLDALDFAGDDTATLFTSVKEFAMHVITFLFTLLGWFIPDFARYDAIETLVNGRNVSLVWVLWGIAELGLLKTTMLLGLAMLLFHRREVAEVSL